MTETKKYARIKKASVEGAWYADKIGQIFEVVHENSITLLTKCGGHHSVLREDAELIVTEYRRPKVGERVLITYGITSSGDYKTGDIYEVRSVVDIYGTITVKEHSNFVMAREYEVIVNSEVKNKDGTKHEASAEDLCTEPMTEEVKQLRCTVADLIGENERLKAKNARLELWNNELRRCIPALSTIATVSGISTGGIVLREINRIAKEVLK
ncbi:hypothetical protein ACIGJL_05960 [Bacillus velezensis]